jgi:hypothetical protein
MYGARPTGEDTIGEVQWSRHELIYSSSTRHTKKPEPCRAPTLASKLRPRWR